jgi:S1-C subfamily serine protease
MNQVTAKTAGWVVSVRPSVPSEPLREIALYDPPPDLLELPPAPGLDAGLSGLVIDQEGHILTSASILGFEPPFQILRDRATLTADLKAVDPDSYLALLKLREVPAGLVSLAAISAKELASGQWLIRHGRSPSGRESRSLAVLESVRTTTGGLTVGMLDTEGSPEMDGSAVISESGEVVGICVKPAGTAGRVLPIKTALGIASRLKSQDIRPKPWAGFALQDLSADLRDYFAVEKGALITKVEAGSPSSKAGLRPKDLIVGINGQEIAAADQVMALVAGATPETPLQLQIRRNSRPLTVSLLPEQPAPLLAEAQTPPGEATFLLKLAPSPGDTTGLVVTEARPVALANRLGIKTGDVIRSINSTSLRTADQFSLLQRRRLSDTAQLWEIQRGEHIFFVAVKERAGIYE